MSYAELDGAVDVPKVIGSWGAVVYQTVDLIEKCTVDDKERGGMNILDFGEYEKYLRSEVPCLTTSSIRGSSCREIGHVSIRIRVQIRRPNE